MGSLESKCVIFLSFFLFLEKKFIIKNIFLGIHLCPNIGMVPPLNSMTLFPLCFSALDLKNVPGGE